MTRILFICLGNICRSPMAEYVMKDLTSKAGLSEQFEIASAATSAWEIGNPVYPPARQKLAEHGIDCNGKTARQMTRLDYARYDHLIGMDESNLWPRRCRDTVAAFVPAWHKPSLHPAYPCPWKNKKMPSRRSQRCPPSPCRTASPLSRAEPADRTPPRSEWFSSSGPQIRPPVRRLRLPAWLPGNHFLR